MWARNRTDIGWSDLIAGLAYLFLPAPPPTSDGLIGE